MASCKEFMDFIDKMQMKEVEYQGQQWTWAMIGRRKVILKQDCIDFLGPHSGLLRMVKLDCNTLIDKPPTIACYSWIRVLKKEKRETDFALIRDGLLIQDWRT